MLIISTLFIGCAFAANSVNDFKVNENYKHVAGNDFYSINLNDNKDAGCLIFKNVDDDAYDDNSDPYDGLIHDDGREYIEVDDDMTINKNPDNTANFTDQQYIVLIFAKDVSNTQNNDLASQLTQFNNDNQVKIIAF